MTIRVDTAVRYTKKDGWTGNRFKEKEVRNAIREELGTYNVNLDDVMGVVKAQDEYKDKIGNKCVDVGDVCSEEAEEDMGDKVVHSMD